MTSAWAWHIGSRCVEDIQSKGGFSSSYINSYNVSLETEQKNPRQEEIPNLEIIWNHQNFVEKTLCPSTIWVGPTPLG